MTNLSDVFQRGHNARAKCTALCFICLLAGSEVSAVRPSEDYDLSGEGALFATAAHRQAQAALNHLVGAYHEDTIMQDALHRASRGNVSRSDGKWFSWLHSSCESKERKFNQLVPKVTAKLAVPPDDLGFIGSAKMLLASRSLFKVVISAKKKGCEWVQTEEVKDTMQDLFDDSKVDSCDNVAAMEFDSASDGSQDTQEASFKRGLSAMVSDSCDTSVVDTSQEAEVGTPRQLVQDSNEAFDELAQDTGDAELEQEVVEERGEDAEVTPSGGDQLVQDSTLDDEEWGFGTEYTAEDENEEWGFGNDVDNEQWGFGPVDDEQWGFGPDFDPGSLMSLGVTENDYTMIKQNMSSALTNRGGFGAVAKAMLKGFKYLIMIVLWAVFCLGGVTVFTLVLGIVLCTIKAVVFSLINLFKSNPLHIGLPGCLKKFGRAFTRGHMCCAGVIFRKKGLMKKCKGGKGGGGRGAGGGSTRGGGRKSSRAKSRASKASYVKNKMYSHKRSIKRALKDLDIDWSDAIAALSQMDLDTLRELADNINDPETLANILSSYVSSV